MTVHRQHRARRLHHRAELPSRRHLGRRLICLHLIVGVVLIMGFIVGVVLIMGFMRFVPRPYQRTGQAVDHPHYGG